MDTEIEIASRLNKTTSYFEVLIDEKWVVITGKVFLKVKENVSYDLLVALCRCEPPYNGYAIKEIKRRWDVHKHIYSGKELWEFVKKAEHIKVVLALQEIWERGEYSRVPSELQKNR